MLDLDFDDVLRISIAGIQAIQQLETDVVASDEGFSYLALCKTGSQLLWCMRRWPYEGNNTRVSVYR